MNKPDYLKLNCVSRQEAVNKAAALLESAKVEDAYLEAEVLLLHSLGIIRSELYATAGDKLNESQAQVFSELIERRQKGEPAAYLTGQREFYGLSFYVDHRVLIPRPETELLVDKSIELANIKYDGQELTIVDVGTGSGAIAVSLACHLHQTRIYATDISPVALAVARINCLRHGVADRITLLEGSLLRTLPEPVNIVVANLPYVSRHGYQSLSREIREHEPSTALLGGEDGLSLIFELLEQTTSRILPGGSLILEIDDTQKDKVAEKALSVFPTAIIDTFKDLASLNRAIVIQL